MAPTPNWKGYLKLSLVSCPIELYPASSTSERITFNTLNRKTGNRVKSIYIDPASGTEVEGPDQVKGYAVAKNEFLIIEDEELDALKLESSHTIDIGTFVPRPEIDPRYMDTPYYIVPEGKVAQEAFAVIREAMREANMVGLGRVVVARRERVIMLQPWDKGMLGLLLRYGYEVRDVAAYFDRIGDVELPAEVKALMHSLVEQKLQHFDATEFKDRYQEALAELVKSKQAHEPAESQDGAAPAQATNVVNIMEALRQSLAGSTPAAKPAEASKASTKPAVSRPKKGKA